MNNNEKLPDPKTQPEVKKLRGKNKDNEKKLQEYINRNGKNPVTVKPGNL